MQIISADAEIERAAEIRSQPEFLAQLPGMFFGQIFRDKPVAATQLRIAEYRRIGWDAVCSGSGIWNESMSKPQV